MPADQILVGSVCIALSIATFVAAVGKWSSAYKLSVAAFIRSRFGTLAARTYYLAMSVTLLAAGAAIISGMRPGFAISRDSDMHHAIADDRSSNR